jgi:hypothetical protein
LQKTATKKPAAKKAAKKPAAKKTTKKKAAPVRQHTPQSLLHTFSNPPFAEEEVSSSLRFLQRFRASRPDSV